MAGSKKDRAKRQREKSAKNKQRRSLVVKKSAPTQMSLLKKPTEFSSFADVVQYSADCVFVIARLRQTGESQTQITTLGTGFLAGKGRLLTCAHVINAEGGHKDDDLYLIAQRNPPSWYQSYQRFELNKTVFIYDKNDSAVLYLPDSFYRDAEGNMLRDPEHYLELCADDRRVGTDVGILGYPLQTLAFLPDSSGVDLNGIIIKADKGVVSTSYTDQNQNHMYEFTMGFNPGNSGGPIMDLADGRVIAMVHGYLSIPISAKLDHIPKGTIEGVDEDQSVISTVRALYSLGLNSVNYISYAKLHDVAVK